VAVQPVLAGSDSSDGRGGNWKVLVLVLVHFTSTSCTVSSSTFLFFTPPRQMTEMRL
jgi:hypothetical protein